MHFVNNKIEKNELDYAISLMKTITEFIVWGEKHDETYFEYFCIISLRIN